MEQRDPSGRERARQSLAMTKQVSKDLSQLKQSLTVEVLRT